MTLLDVGFTPIVEVSEILITYLWRSDYTMAQTDLCGTVTYS
jgi:hypothetical protein